MPRTVRGRFAAGVCLAAGVLGAAAGGASALTRAPAMNESNRPASCPPVPAQQTGPDGEAKTLTGTFPWPAPPAGVNPRSYATYLHTAPDSTPPLAPANWTNGGSDWKLT